MSGYTHCACRDCMDDTVSSDVNIPELRKPCSDAGCETYPPSKTKWRARPVARDECQRPDAYDATN